jgi:streptogramin lyase
MKRFLRSRLTLTLTAFVMIAAAIAIPLSGSITRTHAQGTVTISEFSIPTSGSNPVDITSGPDGNLWFVEFNGDKIGKITPTGTVTEYAPPTSNTSPESITSGPDGNLWFTEQYGASQIGKITPGGTATEYATPTNYSAPTGITSGPDGNLWFTEKFGNKIAKTTTGGTITEYTIPTNNTNPERITSGPDGNLWFTEGNASQIGKITTSGTITEYPIPTGNSVPARITSGPDGNLWFTEASGNQIGKITPSGTITEYTIPTSGGTPIGITSGPDGNLWFLELYGNKIGTITTSGTITEYSLPSGFGYPVGITSGPDGNIWFTEAYGNAIGRVNLSSTTPPSITANPTQGSPGTAITVTGSSWASGDVVDISLSPSVSVLTKATVAGDGTFSTSFTVPANAATGSQFVNARDETTGQTAQAPFTIPSPSGTWITPDDGFSVQAGTTLHLSANAYPALANSSIQHVDFAADWNGSWQTVCTTTSSSNIFECYWNLTDANGTPIPNGGLQVEFTIYDSSGTSTLSPVLQGTITPPQVQQQTSGNWAGYVVTGKQYTDVKGSWVEPAITCGSKETSNVSFWVGLDGSSSKTVEQIGTSAICKNGKAIYFVWYEMYPDKPIMIFTGLQPGDHAQAEVSYQGNDNFKLSITLTDGVNTWTNPLTVLKRKGAARNSAEWIAEASCQNAIFSICTSSPWPQFGTVTFTSCSAGGISIASGPTVSEVVMTYGLFNSPKGQPSPLNSNNTGFSVQWVHP